MSAIPTNRCVIAAVLLIVVVLPAKAELSQQEIDRLTRLVSKVPRTLADGPAASDAMELAAKAGAVQVLEAAINNPDTAICARAAGILPESPIPLAEKRRILLGSLLNQSVWQKLTLGEYSRLSAGEIGSRENRDWQFRTALFDAFGKTVDRKSLNSSSSQEERVALAKDIGGPDIVAKLGNPREATRVWPPASKSTQLSHSGTIEGSVSLPAAKAANPTPSSPPYLWLGTAAALLAGAAWLFLRSRKKT